MNIDIDAKEELKGYITPHRNKFRVYFWDIIHNKNTYIGVFDDWKSAYIAYCNYQYDYYYNGKKYLLPKFITFHNVQRDFVFAIMHRQASGKYKKTHLFTAKSLQEVIEYRKQFIANLL